ncbi:MAG TPA: queuosine salvage family protein [Baekduia sp.]|nr:queuosine salvage family protein [Baekduia sp.]
MGRLTDHIRSSCARVADGAASVRIDHDKLAAYDASAHGPVEDPGLDPVRHYLEGTPAEVALYTLALDTINFGSGWFPTLNKRLDPASGRTVSGYFTVAWNLADHFRVAGPWDAAALRALDTVALADILGQPADHELMSLYTQALRELGRFLGDRGALDVVAAAGGSAEALATTLASSLAFYDDRGFYKRAQIVGNDLALAGVAEFADLDALTIFADNLVPHVLRCDGILIYADDLATRIDAGELLPAGREEREIRACALHACELLSARLGVPARVLDMWLWNRGQAPELKARPRHRTRTVYY